MAIPIKAPARDRTSLHNHSMSQWTIRVLSAKHRQSLKRQGSVYSLSDSGNTLGSTRVIKVLSILSVPDLPRSLLALTCVVHQERNCNHTSSHGLYSCTVHEEPHAFQLNADLGRTRSERQEKFLTVLLLLSEACREVVLRVENSVESSFGDFS